MGEGRGEQAEDCTAGKEGTRGALVLQMATALKQPIPFPFICSASEQVASIGRVPPLPVTRPPPVPVYELCKPPQDSAQP